MKQYLSFLFVLIAVPFATIAQVPNYIPTTGLVAWYPFNGNANDESGNGNNGVVNGATLTADRFANPNSAYDFNGGTDIININNPILNGVTEVSISVWFNPSFSSSGSQYISVFQQDGVLNDGVTYLTYYPSPSNLRFGYGTTSGNLVNVSVSNPSQNWHHAVLVYDGSLLNGYIDGVLIGSTALTSAIYNSIAPFAIGNLDSNPVQGFLGSIDDLGIWNRAVTACEVEQLYSGQLPTPPDASITVNGTTTFCSGGSVELSVATAASYLWSNGETTQSITVTDADDYSVTVTDENGCVGTSQPVTVTVNPNPTVTLAPYSAICANAEALTLTGGSPSGGGYTVNGNSATELDPSVTGSGNQTVVYTYADQNNCLGSATQTVVVNTIPNVSLSGLNTNYTLSDNPSTLTGTPSGGIFNGVGVSNGMFDPAAAGLGTHGVSYAVVDGNGCIGVSSLCTTVDINVGIGGGNQISTGGGLDIYPNPNDGNFNLNVQDIVGLVTYKILDVRGREVLNGSFISVGDHQEIINLSKASNGVYTIQLNTPNGRINGKLVKE